MADRKKNATREDKDRKTRRGGDVSEEVQVNGGGQTSVCEAAPKVKSSRHIRIEPRYGELRSARKRGGHT